MHAIERYGLVALLFLVVTVVAVLMWDGDQKKKPKDSPKESPAAAATAPDRQGRAPAPDGRLVLAAKEQPGPLQRQPDAAPATAQGGLGLEPAGLRPGDGRAHQPVPSVDPAAGTVDAPQATPGKAAAPQREPVVDRPIAATTPAVEHATHAYVVQSGDTLSEIAQRELGSARRWQEIVAANPGLDPARLRAGKSIQVPGAAATPAKGASPAARESALAGAKPAASPARAANGSWTVGKGENLWKIAERALGDGKRWSEIAALNPRLNPDRLALGQVLVLPARSATTPPSNGTKVAGGTKKSTSAAPLVASATDGSAPRRTGKVK